MAMIFIPPSGGFARPLVVDPGLEYFTKSALNSRYPNAQTGQRWTNGVIVSPFNNGILIEVECISNTSIPGNADFFVTVTEYDNGQIQLIQGITY